MPIVPTYQRQSQSQVAPVNTQDLRIPKDNAFTALADVGANALDVYQQQREREDLAFAQDAMLKYQQDADDLINNPQTGLITKQGANAIGQGEQVAAQLSQMASAAFDSIPNGPVKERFRNQFQIAGQPLANRARQYEVGQRQQFEANQQTGMLSNLQRQGSDNYDNQEIIGSSLTLGGNQIVSYGQAHGQSPEEIEANWNEYREGLGRGVLRARVASGKFQQYLDRNGEPSDLGGVSRLSAHGNSSAARGLRNNNPGNIEASDKNPWEGQIGSDGRFAKFETPEHGIRALGKNLLTYYQKHGLDTVGEIITRWAPPKENKTDAYIKAICDQLGVAADQQIDVTNPRTLAALCAGIVNHENGSQPYTDEQIGAGVSAAIGITALPSSKRRTGDLAFDISSPADQASYLSQMQAMQNQYRAQQSDALDQQVKNIYSATDEGLQPDYVPSQQAFINSAKTPEVGLRKWQDMQDQLRYGAAIAAAKNMTPGARDDLLQQLRPTDPNASNFAANQQRWDKMQAKFKQLNAEWEKNQGSARFSSSLQNNFPLDPNDKNNQAAADHYFDQKVAPGFNINNTDSLNQVAEITTKSGMLPTQIKTMLTAGATSRDPAVVVPMAKMYGQIFDNNPAAATGVDKGAMAFYSKVYAYDRAGVPAEKAVDMAYNQVYQQDDRLKQMISQQVRDKDYIKNRAKAAQDNIDNMSPNWQGIGAPTLTDPGKANQLYQRDYLAIYDANFAQTGGDADQAKAMTNAMIGKVWAVSTINGQQEIMKYAPEAVYGVTNGSGNWIKGQWEEEKKALKSSAFGGARDDTDLVLVPDAVTPRDQSYSVMVRQKNAEGYDDVRPYYGENGMPLRFRPEQKTSPMYKQTMDIQQQRVDAARAARQEEKQPAFTNQQGYTPPDFTKPFGTGIANQLPSNITAGGQ